MSPSVCFRLIRGLRSRLNKVVEVVSEKLSKRQVHAQPGADGDFSLSALNARLTQGHYYAVVEQPCIEEQIRAGDRHMRRFNNRPCFLAYAKRLSASNHDLIAHCSILPSQMVNEILPPASPGVYPKQGERA